MEKEKRTAVYFMLLSSFSFAVMQLFVKLSSAEIGTFEQTFFRNLVSFFIAAYMVRKEGHPLLQEIRRGGFALFCRSFFGFLGILLFFYATAHGRQADVAMLNRSSPVFVTLFAALFLKEKLTFPKVASTALCLLGAYIAMQPSFDSNPLPLASALLGAVVAGIAYTLVSYCKSRVHPSVIIFHFSLFSTICAGLLMLKNFVLPSPKTLLMLLMIGVFAAAGQFFLTYSYRKAPASEVSIYQFSGVVFTALISYLVLKETLSFSSVLGGFIILCAIFWIFQHQKKASAN